MSRSDESRTPSGWHDDAYGRDAGHDEMQAQQWRQWKNEHQDASINRNDGTGDARYFYAGVSVEFAFLERGRVIGFADIAVLFKTREPDLHRQRREAWSSDNHAAVPWEFEPERWWCFYELKPVIGSVGAVIRQCRATDILAERAGFKDFEVIAVVYEDDPKADLLVEMCPYKVVTVDRSERP